MIDAKGFQYCIAVMFCLSCVVNSASLLASQIAESKTFFQYFKRASDLTEERLGKFLNVYPSEKQWVLNYVSNLPEYILTDRKRLHLSIFIQKYADNEFAKNGAQKRFLPVVESGFLLNSFEKGSVQFSETPEFRGWNYRFYRGPVFEYHFDGHRRLKARPHKGLISYEIDLR